MASGAGLRGTTVAASENGGHGGTTGGAPNAASSVASSVRPSGHACTAGLHNSITAAAHSTTVTPVSQRPLRRPSHSAPAAKQPGSCSSQNPISGTTNPTDHVSVPISGVKTGHGKVVISPA